MTRTKYMQDIMTATYSQVAIIAIQNGTIEGAWGTSHRRKITTGF